MKTNPPMLVSVRRIWDLAPHNAFTDLLIHEGRFYCTFREAKSHAGDSNGTIRIIKSLDGSVWESIALVEEEGTDLRDPKLSIMPDGRAHLLMGGSRWNRIGELVSTGTRIAVGSFEALSPVKKVLPDNEWLWRLTWHQGVGYGLAYRSDEISLYQTTDGVRFDKTLDFNMLGEPTEGTIRFNDDGKMMILLRRQERWSTHALLGLAPSPFDSWDWYDLGYAVGGPNFIFAPNGRLWLAGRLLYAGPWGLFARTALLVQEGNSFRRELVLPSFGDTGYPGLAWHDGFLYVSYYSTHEEKTAIYLAKVLI